MKSRSCRCLVCNQTQDETSQQHGTGATFDIFTSHSGELLAKRLERILEERLESNKCHTRILCERCHGQVVEIEGYYRVIDEFRHLYHETAGLHKQEDSRPEAFDSLIDTGLLELEKLLGIDHDDPSVQALLKAESTYRHEPDHDPNNKSQQNSVWKDTTTLRSQDSDVKSDDVKGRNRKTGLRTRGPAKTNLNRVTTTVKTDLPPDDHTPDALKCETDNLKEEKLKAEGEVKSEEKEKREVVVPHQSNGQESMVGGSADEGRVKRSSFMLNSEPVVALTKLELTSDNCVSEGESIHYQIDDRDMLVDGKGLNRATTMARKRRAVQNDTPAKETMKLRRRLPRQASQQVSKGTATDPTDSKIKTATKPSDSSDDSTTPTTFHNPNTVNSDESKAPVSDPPSSSTATTTTTTSTSTTEKSAGSNVNPYTCSTCQSGFKTRHDFYRHIRTCGKTNAVTNKNNSRGPLPLQGPKPEPPTTTTGPSSKDNAAKSAATDNVKDTDAKSESVKNDEVKDSGIVGDGRSGVGLQNENSSIDNSKRDEKEGEKEVEKALTNIEKSEQSSEHHDTKPAESKESVNTNNNSNHQVAPLVATNTTESNLEVRIRSESTQGDTGGPILAPPSVDYVNQLHHEPLPTPGNGSFEFPRPETHTYPPPPPTMISHEHKVDGGGGNLAQLLLPKDDGLNMIPGLDHDLKLPDPSMLSPTIPIISPKPKTGKGGNKGKGKAKGKGSKSKGDSKKMANQGGIPPPNAFVEGPMPSHPGLPGQNGPHHMHPQPLHHLPQQQQGYPQQQRPPLYNQGGGVHNQMYGGPRGAPPPYGQRPGGYQYNNQTLPQGMGSPGGTIRPGMMSPRSQGYPGMDNNQQWSNMYQDGYNNQAYMGMQPQQAQQQQMHMQQQQQQQQQRSHMQPSPGQHMNMMNTQYNMGQGGNMQQPQQPMQQQAKHSQQHLQHHGPQQQGPGKQEQNMQMAVHAGSQEQGSQMNQPDVNKNRQQPQLPPQQQQQQQQQLMQNQAMKMNPQQQNQVHMNQAQPQSMNQQQLQQHQQPQSTHQMSAAQQPHQMGQQQPRQHQIGQQQQQQQPNQVAQQHQIAQQQQHTHGHHPQQQQQLNQQQQMNPQHQMNQQQMNPQHPINQQQMHQQHQMNPLAMNQSGMNIQQQQSQHQSQLVSQQPYPPRPLSQHQHPHQQPQQQQHHMNQQHPMQQQQQPPQQPQQRKDPKQQQLGQDPLGMGSQPPHPASRGSHMPGNTHHRQQSTLNGPCYPFMDQSFSTDNIPSQNPQQQQGSNNMYMGARNQAFPGSSPPPTYPQPSCGGGGGGMMGSRMPPPPPIHPHHPPHDPNTGMGMSLQGQHQVPNSNTTFPQPMVPHSGAPPPSSFPSTNSSSSPSLPPSSTSTSSQHHLMMSQQQQQQQQQQRQSMPPPHPQIPPGLPTPPPPPPPPPPNPHHPPPTHSMDQAMSNLSGYPPANPNPNPLTSPAPLVPGQGSPYMGPNQGAPGSAGSSHQMAAGVGGGGGSGVGVVGGGGEFKPPPTSEGGYPCASALVSLAKTHSEPKTFKCAQCEATFFNGDALMEHTSRVHQLVEDDASSANHDDADRASSNATPASSSKDLSPEPAPSPQPHKKQRKNREPKSWRCAKCNITCENAEDWAEHRRSHMGEKAYHCPTCGVAFAAKWYLTRHQRTHSGEKPHKCDICGKAFGRPDHLRKHMTIHTSKTSSSSTSGSPTTSL